MRQTLKTLMFALAALATGSATFAHHSYAATYDVTREVTLEGKIVQFVYRNPHSFVHVVAKGDNGAQERWAVEWSGTTQLGNSGVTRDTLKIGDAVVIQARPSRVQGEFRALMLKLKRTSDGFTWGNPGQQVD
jgi:DNA/RNA endonuclease YhcR with UshA esterase domain